MLSCEGCFAMLCYAMLYMVDSPSRFLLWKFIGWVHFQEGRIGGKDDSSMSPSLTAFGTSSSVCMASHLHSKDFELLCTLLLSMTITNG